MNTAVAVEIAVGDRVGDDLAYHLRRNLSLIIANGWVAETRGSVDVAQREVNELL